MEFFNSAIDVLQTLVTAIGAGLAVWGAINLLKATATTTPARKDRASCSSSRSHALKTHRVWVRKFPCSMVALTKIIKQIPGHELCYVTRRCRRRRRALAKGLQRVPSAQRTNLPNAG